MKKKETIYIAGPMTGLAEFNYPAFHAAAKALRDSGMDVVNPAEHFGGDQARKYEDYMRADVTGLLRCTDIGFLPGWEKSKGAIFEATVAQRLGLRCYLIEQAGAMTFLAPIPGQDVDRAIAAFYAATPAAEPSTPDDLGKGGVKYDTDKPQFTLIPHAALEGVARVLMYGAKKYDAWNWRKGMRWCRVTDAALRHVYAWLDGEDDDPETKLNHIDHALCELLFLREYIRAGTGNDDRYKVPHAG